MRVRRAIYRYLNKGYVWFMMGAADIESAMMRAGFPRDHVSKYLQAKGPMELGAALVEIGRRRNKGGDLD